MDRNHIKINRPSTLYYMSLCPGFLAQEGSDGKDAERGTLLHKCVEDNAPELAGNEFDRAQVRTAIEYRDRVIEELPGEKHQYPEQRLFSSLHPNGGTSDDVICAVFEGNLYVHIIDYKFGFIPVTPPEDNPQFLSYVVMAFETFPSAKGVTFHVVFPGLGQFAEHTFEPKDVPVAVHKIKKVAEQVASATVSSYIPNHGCMYCARCANCPRLLHDATPTVLDVAEHSLKVHDSPDVTLSLFSTPPETMTNEELRKSRAIAKATFELLEHALKHIDEEIQSRGVELFGLRVQKRSGSYSFKDPGSLFRFLSDTAPEVFGLGTPQGVSNVLRLLEEIKPSIPVTRFFPALSNILESYPEQAPLRLKGLPLKALRATVIEEIERYQQAQEGDIEILAQGAEISFVAKAPGVGYGDIYRGGPLDIENPIDIASIE
jgi:hypothetical protein